MTKTRATKRTAKKAARKTAKKKGKNIISLNPVTAYGYVESVVKKYTGTPEAPATYDDFKVLDQSLAILKNVVIEHARLKKAFDQLVSSEKAKAIAEGKVVPINRRNRRAKAAKKRATKRPAKKATKKRTAKRKRSG